MRVIDCLGIIYGWFVLCSSIVVFLFSFFRFFLSECIAVTEVVPPVRFAVAVVVW